MQSGIELLIGTQAGLIIAFLATACLVIVSGIKLSVYGDAMGDRTGLGSGLVGLIFLAAVTSLPELVVSLTSILRATDLQVGADLAVGNMLGSNVFNLLILGLLVLLFPKKFNPSCLKDSHTDTALYGLVLLAIFLVAFFTAPLFSIQVPLLGCGLFTLLLPIVYGIMLRRENSKPKVDVEECQLPEEKNLANMPAARFYSALAALCGCIIGGGILLSILGSRMSLPPEQGGFGLEASLIGTLFLAISTSLPELVISISSVRLGFLDMAVGNVYGSNMFNLLIIFAADLAMRNATILKQASRSHAISAICILLLTLISMRLLRNKSKLTRRMIAWGMIIIYIGSFMLMNQDSKHLPMGLTMKDKTNKPPNLLPTYLLLGQSNMQGIGNYADLPQDWTKSLETNEKIHYYSSFIASNQFSRLRPYTWDNELNYSMDYAFGPEYSFIDKIMKDRSDEDILFLKHAYSSTSLYGAWSKDWTEKKAIAVKEDGNKAKRYRLYSRLMTHVDRAMEYARGLGYDGIHIDSILWVQGELDGLYGFAANSYKENLKQFISDLKTDLPNADFRFICFQVSMFYGDHMQTVRAAQKEVANELDDVEVILSSFIESPKDFPRAAGDKFHYDARGLINMGKAFAVLNAWPGGCDKTTTKNSATVNSVYTGTLINDIPDLSGSDRSYFKLTGPDWLSVNIDGTLTGTPTDDDLGLNKWAVMAVDETNGLLTTELHIVVE